MTATIALVAMGIWLVCLTYVVVSMRSSYAKLLKHTGGSIDHVFTNLVKKDEVFQKELGRIGQDVTVLQRQFPTAIQKVGLVKFDSFGRDAGEQSIALALLNDLQSGVIVTFLHTRDGVRVYGKHVEAGKGKEYDLSEEEKEAINKAV